MKDIIEFKGKNTSWYKDLNLLQQKGNLYIMDNHNAALWCWSKHIDINKKYNILHIDCHYDTRASHIESWLAALPKNFNELTLQDYLNLKYIDPNFGQLVELFRWDNYFPIFHNIYSKNINEYYFFTHKEGTMYEMMESKVSEYPIPGLFNLVDYLFDIENTGDFKWIVNIDLDYFFRKIDYTNITLKFISDDAIEFFIKQLKKYDNRIEVITIALSPECCGG